MKNNSIISFIRETGELQLKEFNKENKKREEIIDLFQSIEKVNLKRKKWLNKKSIEVPSLLVIHHLGKR